MNRARTAAAALAAAGILSATAACSGSAQKPPSPTATASATTGTTAATLPATPPGAQARWLLGAIAHLPIPAAAITAHFDQVFLAKISGRPAERRARARHVLAAGFGPHQHVGVRHPGRHGQRAAADRQRQRRRARPDQRPGAGRGRAAARTHGARDLGRRRQADPAGGAADPAARRQGHRRRLPDRPRRGRHDPGPARLGLQALRARRAGAGHRRGHGQLGPAAHPHQPADEPALRRTGDRTRRHSGDGTAGSRRT